MVRLGHTTLSSFFERDENGAITINDLLKSVHTSFSVAERQTFSLISAVVNHEIGTQMGASIGPGSTEEMSLGQEVVCFAIVEKPFVAINGGSNINYSIGLEIHSNFVYNPKLWDAFSNAIKHAPEEYERAAHGRLRRHVVRPGVQRITKYNPTVQAPPAKGHTPSTFYEKLA